MLSVSFIHETNKRDKNKEKIIRNFCICASHVLPLPSHIQVRILDLNPNVYGGACLDWRFKHRLELNSVLQLSELPLVLTHELIHLSQMHTGVLSVTRDGKGLWNNKAYAVENLSYEEYLMLPWEYDVSSRESDTLKNILEISKKILTTQ